jgi:hypothetical protein
MIKRWKKQGRLNRHRMDAGKVPQAQCHLPQTSVLKKNIVQQAVLSKIFYPETRRNTYKNISQAIDRQAEHLVKNSVYGRIQQRQTEDKKKEKYRI